jgi:mycothiol system anti-sigma-R factor
MADCNETIRELDSFLDGELPDDVRAHIHDHLDSCMDCLQAFDFQAELKLAIRRKCSSDEMPPTLLSKIEYCFTEIDADTLFDEDTDSR